MTAKPPPDKADAEVSSNPVERCEIALWHGYLTSAFYARRVDDGTPVTEPSRTFRWRSPAPPPDEPSMQRALADVVAAIEHQGWLETDCGTQWFSKRFERLAPQPASAPRPTVPEPQVTNPLPPPLPPQYTQEPVVPQAASDDDETAPHPDGRRWQIAAIAALPAALAMLGWLIAGGG